MCRFPFVCVSIGLTIGKIPTIGVVYNPIINEVRNLLFCGYLQVTDYKTIKISVRNITKFIQCEILHVLFYLIGSGILSKCRNRVILFCCFLFCILNVIEDMLESRH